MITKRTIAIIWLALMLYAALQTALIVRGGSATFMGVFIGSAINEHIRLFSLLGCMWLITYRLHSWHWWWQVPIYCLMAALLSLMLWGMSVGMLFALGQTRSAESVLGLSQWILLQHLLENGVCLAVIVLVQYRREIRQREERERELRLLNTQMELAALRAQLNPHFLFNALNAVNSLVVTDPERARTVLETLADLLRYSLESDRRETVRLGDELDFVRKYLSIEQERFGKRLQTSIEASEALWDAPIPPILIQPLVENAVKHGVAPKAAGGTVSVIVRTDAAGKRLCVEIHDDGVGMNHSTNQHQAHSTGIGLANTDARLRKLFGEDSALNVQSTEHGTTVIFSLPIHGQEP